MRDEQVEKIIEAIVGGATAESPTTQRRIDDTIVKNIGSYLIALSLAGTIWLISTTAQIDKKMGQTDIQFQNMQKEQSSAANNMMLLGKRFEEFAKEPRFAQKDFLQQTVPLSNGLRASQEYIADIRTDIRSMEKRVARNESHYEVIIEKMEELKEDIKHLSTGE